MRGFSDKLYYASDFIMKIAYLNILWMVFTILGGVILGWAPSTIALFTVVRNWIKDEKDQSFFNTFWTTYKKEFLKANALGAIILIVGYILSVNLQFILQQSGIGFFALRIFTLIIMFICFCALLIIFPMYVQYELPFLQYFNKAVMIGFVKPVWTIILVIGFSVSSFILLTLPGLIPFFGISFSSYLIMSIAFQTFHSLEKHLDDDKTTDKNLQIS